MNEMKLEFLSKLENESFARTSVVAFLMPLNLPMDCVMELKTMLAEAVVNAMIHGYEKEEGMVKLHVFYDEECIHMEVRDEGCGIEDIEQVMEPMYTSKAHLERSGMGMTIMQAFADQFHVTSQKGSGTLVEITKRIPNGNASD
ncbi:anti-sigma F factor [Amedibacillus sp. YH-ame10]